MSLTFRFTSHYNEKYRTVSFSMKSLSTIASDTAAAAAAAAALTGSMNNPTTVYLALGSNIGDKARNIHQAIDKIQSLGQMKSTSFLYESAPMYHSEQESFYNAACCIETILPPHDLLSELKMIEEEIGRKETFRNGPRVIDIDILFYGEETISSEKLILPHPRIKEREFVLQPLCDLNPTITHEIFKGETISHLLTKLSSEQLLKQGKNINEGSLLRRIIPVYNHKLNVTRNLNISTSSSSSNVAPILMSVLNITPDSFSDGGRYYDNLKVVVDEAMRMVAEGATILDIGGESTRPGAAEVEIQEEIDRVVPVIEAIRKAGLKTFISIDTRKSKVAKAAIDAGADIINDVSAGTFDQNMLPLVKQLHVPYIAMHMRGDPATMLQTKHVTYENSVLIDVIQELSARLSIIDSVIPRWLQIVDPGIGFAKGYTENMELLQPQSLRLLKQSLNDRPLLIGLSRKRFLGRILDETLSNRISLIDGKQMEENSVIASNIENKDLATAGACCAALLGGADILRVHNVSITRAVCDTFIAINSYNDK